MDNLKVPENYAEPIKVLLEKSSEAAKEAHYFENLCIGLLREFCSGNQMCLEDYDYDPATRTLVKKKPDANPA